MAGFFLHVEYIVSYVALHRKRTANPSFLIKVEILYLLIDLSIATNEAFFYELVIFNVMERLDSELTPTMGANCHLRLLFFGMAHQNAKSISSSVKLMHRKIEIVRMIFAIVGVTAHIVVYEFVIRIVTHFGNHNSDT